MVALHYSFVYDDCHKSHKLANIDIISTASVDAQLVRNAAPARGGARGRGRGAGALRASGYRRNRAARENTASSLIKSC